jgi:CRP/FNR family transcriptional regulator, cyclic AMP receptor protein
MSSLIQDFATFKKRLARLPVVAHRAGEVVLTAGSKGGELLFLRSGAVEVIKDGVHIASVSAPGSVFGEQAALLDQPHTADVRTLEQSEFYVANAQAMLARDPTVALYVAAILARRLDAGNRSLVEVKHQIQSGEPLGVIGKAVEKVETQLNHSVRDPTGR